jgi:hypothetical protein
MKLPAAMKNRGTQTRLVWVGLLVLVAGGIAAIVTFVGGSNSGTNGTLPAPHNGNPVNVSKVPKHVKFSEEQAKLAQKFIATNVVRKNLAQGYQIVGPDLKEGLTLKQWLTGSIPVVPYPADALGKIPIQIIYSYPREAVLRVFLLPKAGSNQTQGGAFWLKLDRYGTGAKAHWLVNGWTPYASTEVPGALNSP